MGPFSEDTGSRIRTAIIGTGLAGLTTAYLLQNDEKKRYEVTLFEQAPFLSFDAASVTIKNQQTNTTERIDLPMRASAGGYYTNLHRLYRHLTIPLHPVRFLFVFASALQPPTTYFIHPSNHHILPPRPPSSLLTYLFEIISLLISHTWFTLSCFFISPSRGDSLADYLARIQLPKRYQTHYLLPLLSAVCTCTHQQLLEFPAGDIIGYVKKSFGKDHYTVCGGVGQVQEGLVRRIGVEGCKVRVRRTVISVVKEEQGRVVVRWQEREGGEVVRVSEEVFDRVVLAVSPDVAGRLYSELGKVLGGFPTVRVESLVFAPEGGGYSTVEGREGGEVGCMHHGEKGKKEKAQTITLRTRFLRDGMQEMEEARSEALHAMPSGVVVSTCPLEEGAGVEEKRVLKTASFTRTLRTVESQRVVQGIMGNGGDVGWVNGQDNVWLAGSWCWDGMVLLEGCVVSAMRVAEDFGVEIPW